MLGLGGVVIVGGLLFAASGTIDWAQGWTFLALWAIATASPHVALARENPSLLTRRARNPSRGRPHERVMVVVRGLCLLAIAVLAGLETQRLGVADLPVWLVYPGTLMVLLGGVIEGWAMTENNHYEAGMRIQRDVGHKVVYHGPYRIVRHPGYLAVIIRTAGAPLVLGSIWAWIPAGVIIATMMARALIEDRALREELKGYIAYTRQVPTMLLPGVW